MINVFANLLSYCVSKKNFANRFIIIFYLGDICILLDCKSYLLIHIINRLKLILFYIK